MDLQHQLTPRLKRLRLSGILETLDVRNQQAIGEKWSYVEFLTRLVEDEVERRDHKQLALRLRRATVNTGRRLWAMRPAAAATMCSLPAPTKCSCISTAAAPTAPMPAA